MPQLQEVACPQGLAGIQALRDVCLKIHSQWKTCGISAEFVGSVEKCLRKHAVTDSRYLSEVLQEAELMVSGVAKVMVSIKRPGFLQSSYFSNAAESGEERLSVYVSQSGC